jgi:hypothetical protein
VSLLFKATKLERFLSYIYPVVIEQGQGSANPYLEFLLYRNQWQLATEDAIYSDGIRYKPLHIALKNISFNRIQQLTNCLILGAGLGSAVQILHKKYKCKAQYKLVEVDGKILNWAMLLLEQMGIDNITGFENDAYSFMKEDEGNYDLIFVDIFNGRSVPNNFIQKEFLENSRNKLIPKGMWVMNYILDDQAEWNELVSNATETFKGLEIYSKNLNRLLVYNHP